MNKFNYNSLKDYYALNKLLVIDFKIIYFFSGQSYILLSLVMSPALNLSLCPIIESFPGTLDTIVGLPSCENACVE